MNNVFRQMISYMFGGRGIHFISGAQTVTGNFYGLSVGSVKPDTIKVTPTQEMYINGSAVTSDTDLADYLLEGEFVPIKGSQVVTTGSGYLKAYMTV